jgi:hypothetical protein
MWNLASFCLEIVLVSVQDRCTVCVKRTIGSENILDTTDGTPKWCGSSESSVHLEIAQIILDAPNGTLGDTGPVESFFFPFGDSVSVYAR